MSFIKLTLTALLVLVFIVDLFSIDVIKIGFGPKGAPTTGYNILASSSIPSSAITVGTPKALVDSTGAATSITFTQINGTALAQGAPSPATDLTANTYNLPYFSVNICYIWAYNFNPSTTFELAGFSASDVVSLDVLSSRGYNGITGGGNNKTGTSRITTYAATGSGAAVTAGPIEAFGNYTQLANLPNISPDANGKITLVLSSSATIINALRISRLAASGPSISTSTSVLSGFNYVVDAGPSTNQTFTVSASLLTTDITINPTAHFEISTNGSTYSNTPLTISQSGGTVASTTIYVRLKAGAVVGSYNENISIQSTNATNKTVACSGSVTDAGVQPPPSPTQQINLSPSTSRANTLALKTRTWSSTIGNASVCMWKDDKEGAFSITIDDNIENQVNDWLTNTAGTDVKLTWFLINQGGSWPTNWDPSDVSASNVVNYGLYANALAAGHNIGGHDNRNWYGSSIPSGVINPDSTKYVTRIIATKNKINTELNTLANHYSCLTYAYPYGSFPSGVNGDPWARNQFIALRGVIGGTNKAENTNYQNLQITELLAGYPWRDNYVRTVFVDKSIGLFNRNNYRGWTVHLFHSLNSQASKDSALNLVRYLDLKKDSIWAGGFQQVAQYAQSRDTHHLTSTVVDATHINFTLTDDMNDAMYNFPLTVKVVVPANWNSAVASQNGKVINTRFLTYNGNKYLFVDAVPDGGMVTITGSNVVTNLPTTSDEQLKIFQNPFNPDYVTVSLPKQLNCENLMAALYTVNGMLVTNLKTSNDNEFQLNLSRYPNQVYILKCITPVWSSCQKIIKL